TGEAISLRIGLAVLDLLGPEDEREEEAKAFAIEHPLDLRTPRATDDRERPTLRRARDERRHPRAQWHSGGDLLRHDRCLPMKELRNLGAEVRTSEIVEHLLEAFGVGEPEIAL